MYEIVIHEYLNTMHSSFHLCANKIDVEAIRKKFILISPHLDEFRRRIWAAAEVKTLGRGGLSAVSKVTGLSRNTIKKGIHELENQEFPSPNRIRRAGGGRKKAEKKILP